MSTARERLVRGLVSGLLHEAFMVVVSFGAMLVLVRLLTPRDYGEAAAVAGVLALARGLSGAFFVEHALQHAKDREPDWDVYVALVGAVQFTLFVLINVIAVASRLFEDMRTLAPLLHLASCGLLFDWPAQVATVKLRRELRFERLKVLAAIAFVLRFATAIPLAWLGLGAVALVISGNVLLALPMAVHFLAVEKWRPREGRLLWPGPEQRGPIVAFAREQIAGGLVQSIRSVAESVVLTNTLGVATFGLVNRALALYQSTIGRVGSVFLDAAYPLLPLEREDHVRYRQRASRFVQVGLILSVPGAAFLVLEGAHVSRLLFGDTWIEADPYLAPAAVALAAGTLATSASYVLLGAGRVRSSVLAESLVAVGALAALSTTLVTTVTSHYMWVFAGVHVVAAVVAVAMATPLLESSWLREGLWPSVSASVAAMVVVMALRASTALEGPLGVAVSAALFAGSASIVVALTAPAVVREVLRTHRALAFRSSVAPSQAEA